MWKWFGISDIKPHWLFGHDWSMFFDTDPPQDINGRRIYHDTMRCSCGATKQMNEKLKTEMENAPVKKCKACFPDENTKQETQHSH
jgi:hypothetical protein